MLIAIAGKARVGKDTVGRYLSAKYGFEHFYFAKPLKMMLEYGLGLRETDFQTTEDKEKVIPGLGRSYRYLAQTLGTEWGRNLVHPDLWVQIVAMRWARIKEAGESPGLVLTDCRFDNEARWVREAGGVVVHMRGTGEHSGMTEQMRAHVSESGVSVMQDDWALHNDYDKGSMKSLLLLYSKVDVLLANLGFPIYAS